MPGLGVYDLGQVNYSVDLLRRDEQERSHITNELRLIKGEYGIKSCTVLEVGCGLGQNLEVFRSDNNVLGIEGLASAVGEACSRGLTVVQGDLESELDMRAETVDWLLCLDVLEHLERPLNLMLEMRKVLRIGGRAILNVPNHFDLSGRLKLLLGHNWMCTSSFRKATTGITPICGFLLTLEYYRWLRQVDFGSWKIDLVTSVPFPSEIFFNLWASVLRCIISPGRSRLCLREAFLDRGKNLIPDRNFGLTEILLVATEL